MVLPFIGIAIYWTLMCFGNTIFPTLLAVFIFTKFSQVIETPNFWTKLALDVAILGLTIQIGLWCWAFLDVVAFNNRGGITLENIIHDHKTEFRFWQPIAMLLTVIVPITFEALKSREKKPVAKN